MVEKGVKKRCFGEKSHKTALVAERVGFEPTGRLITDQTISSPCCYPDFGRRQEIMTEITGA